MTATQMPPAPSLAAGSDSGISASDGLTDLATPTFTGSAVAGATVTLYDTDGTTVIGTATANGTGVWSIVATMPLDDGPHSFTITAKAPGFDVSPRSQGLAVTIDTAAPDAPTAPAVTADTDTGASALDGITADGGKGKPPLNLKGRAEPGSTVQVFNGAGKTALATVTAGADGTYAATLTGLKDDTYSFTATATDAAGNVGKPSGATSVTVDTAAPAAPATPTLTPGSDTGTLHDDGTTSDATPTLVGTAEAGATVELFDTDGAMVGKAKADSTGAYAITVPVSSELVSGAHALTVKAVDAAGNTSAGSGALNIVADTTPATATSTPTLSFFGGVNEIFSVHFDEAVSTVSASDFVLSTTGSAVGSIQGVSGSGRDYKVTVNGLAGAGDIGLLFSPTSRITDAAGNPVSFSETDSETISDAAPEMTVGIVSSSAAGVAGTGAHASPSASGRIVAFDSSDGQLVAGGPAGAVQNVYVKDMQTGGISLISAGTDGPANHDSWFPSLSRSATTIAFVSAATNLVPGGTPAGQFNLYVASLTLADPSSGDSVTVVPGSLRLVASGISNELNATLPNGLPDHDIDREAPAPAFLSADGSTVAFLSDSVLAAGGSSAQDNVYLENLSTGAVTFVGSALSLDGISADGTKVAYVGHNTTAAGTEYSGNDTYSAIHVYDSTTGQTTVLDGNAFSVDGMPGHAVTPVPLTPNTAVQSFDYVETFDPTLSADGTKVAYLVENEFPGGAVQGDVNGLMPQQAVAVETNLATGATNEISPIVPVNSASSSTASRGGGLVLYANPSDVSLDLYDTASRTTTAIAVAGGSHVAATLTSGGNAATFNTEPSEIVDRSDPPGDTYNYRYDVPSNMFYGGASDSTVYETNFGVTAGIDPIGTRGEIGAAALAQAIANGGLPVSGTTDAPQGSNVVVTVADAATGGFSAPFSGTVTAGGRWTASVPASALQALAAEGSGPDGRALALSVQVGTSRGASFQALLPFTLDTAAPATPDAPKLDAGSDASVGHVGTLTNRDQPVITGTAEAGAAVTLTDTDHDDVVGHGTADSQGVYAITAGPLDQGLDHLAVTATDAAGNASAPSAALALTVDSVAPVAPGAPKLAAGSDTGASGSDGVTDTATPTITGGDAEAGTTVTLTDTDGIAVLGTAAVDAKGNYLITPAGLEDGAHTLTVTATDRAGNVSPVSGPLQVTIDTLPPLAPTIDDGVGQLAIVGQTVDVTGRAEPGTTVTLQVDGGNIDFGQATASSFGDYEIDSDALSPGAHKLTVIATDLAGNASQPSLTANVTIAGGKVPPPPPPALPQPGAPDGTPLADGVASDGYIAGATVFADADRNGVPDPGEDSTVTDAVGRFSTYGGNSPLVLTGGTDTGTGVALPGELNAPAGDTVITPLTTYYDAYAKVTGQTLSDAVYGSASASLGIDPSGHYTDLDPVDQLFYEGSISSGNPLYAGFGIAEAKLMDTAADVAAVIGGAGGTVATGFSAAFDAIARAAAASSKPIDLDAAATIQAILLSATLEAAPATTVNATAAAAAAQAIAAGNTALDGFNYASASALTVSGDIDAAETVAQGALAAALTAAAKEPTLAPAVVTSFTGPALTAAVDGDKAVVLPAPVLSSGTDAGLSPSDEVTSITTPTFIGTAAPGSAVTLVDSDLGSGTEGASLIVGTGTANAQGRYSIATSALSYGDHRISAIQTPPGTSLNIGLATRTALAQAIDRQGFIQTDPAHVALIPDGSPSVLVDVDIVDPRSTAAVSITTVADAAGNGSDATHTALLVAGTFSSADNAAELIQVYVDGATTPAASGSFTLGRYDLTLPALADGPHTLVVTETTTGGAVIARSSPFATTVAAAPVLNGTASANGGLVGASVFEDADENGYGGPTGARAPYDDPAATTDGAGGFSFAPIAVDPNRNPPAASLAATIVEGGYDAVTGLPLGGATALANGQGPGSAVLEAPFGYGQVDALTSVVEGFVGHEEAVAYYGSSPRTYEPVAVALAAAEPEALAALGLPAGTDLSTLDPLAAAEAGSPAAFLENAKLLDTFAMLSPFLGNGAYGSLVNLVIKGESTNLDDPATLVSLLQSDVYLTAGDRQTIAMTVAASDTAVDAYAATATGPADLISHALAVETVAQEAETSALIAANKTEYADLNQGITGFTGFATIAQAYTGDALTAAVATALGQSVQVTSFLPVGTAPTDAATVDYTLTLSRPVGGVTAGDFSVTASGGITGARVTGVSAVAGSGGARYDVTVATGVGQGTIALGFAPKSLVNASGTPLNHGSFAGPAFYTDGSQAAVGELAVGDFNGDGRPDIVSVNDDGTETTGLTLYLDQGGGSFAPQSAVHTGPDFDDGDAFPSAVAVGDFDGDGKLDVALTDRTTQEAGVTAGAVSVLLGNGDGTFGAPILSTAPLSLTDIAAGDFNGDGKLDVVTASSAGYPGTSALQVQFGNGDGTFTAGPTLAIGGVPAAIAVADLDRDGHLDIVATDSTGDDVAIYRGNGDGTFQAATTIATGQDPTGLAVGDINGDGIPDIVVVNQEDGTLSVLLGHGDGTFTSLAPEALGSPVNVSNLGGPGLATVTIGDLDGDGKADLLVRNEDSQDPIDSNFVLLGNGDGTFQPGYGVGGTTSGAVRASLQNAVLGDFDGDGRTDIASPAYDDAAGGDDPSDGQYGIDVLTDTAGSVLPATSAPATIDRPAAAAPVVTEIAGGGTLTRSGDTYTLDLGTLAPGQAAAAVQFALSNRAASGADAFDGIFAAPSGSGFAVAGASLPGPLSAGQSYSGLTFKPDTSALGAHTETLAFAPRDQTDASGRSTTLATGDLASDDPVAGPAIALPTDVAGELPTLTLVVTDDVVAATTPLAALGTVASVTFGDVRVGTPDSRTLAVANTAAAGSGSLDVSAAAGGQATVTGSIANLAPGATDSSHIVVGLDTSAPGARSGTVTLTPSSDPGTGTPTPVPGATVAVSGAVYRPAAATVAPVSTIVHVGDPGTVKIGVANADPADGYSENLVAALTGTTGAITGSGTTGEIAAGTSDATSLALSFSTATAGVIAGTATLGLTSDGGADGATSAIDGLGTLVLPAASVPVSITVDNHAEAALAETAGGGTFAATAGGYTLDLGTVAQGSAPVTVALAALNAATGPADLLSGGFTEGGSAAFTNAVTAATDVEAGGSQAVGTVTLSTAAAGAVSETIAFAATGSNASGYSAAVAGKTLTILADIAPPATAPPPPAAAPPPPPAAVPPIVTAVAVSGAGIATDGSGVLGAGRVVTIGATTSEPVTVSGGTPTLALNDGGVATYTGGSGTNDLTFAYRVAAGQNTPDLSVTGLASNGASVTDAAGEPLDPDSVAAAARPSGALLIDTTAPGVSSPTIVASPDSGPTPIGIGAPSDDVTAPGSLAVAVDTLPDDGTVTLSDGTTSVTAGESLSVPQLQGLEFTPTPDAEARSSTFTYTVADAAGNVATGTATLNVGGPGTPSAPVVAGSEPVPTVVGSAPNPSAPDAVSIARSVTYRDGVATVTGTASSPAGVSSVDISALVDGARQDLGTATVDADGTFDFADLLGIDRQAFFVATLTDGAGGQATSTDPGFNLTGGLGPAGKTAKEEEFDATEQVSTALLRPDGRRFLSIIVPDLTEVLRPFDVVADHDQGGTTFVFEPGDAFDVVSGFDFGGADHDTIELPSSDFSDFAAVLRNASDVNGGALITDPRTDDRLYLQGKTTTELKAHPKDFTFA